MAESPGSARATSSGRRLICISKGPPRPHPLPQPGPAMFTREPSAWGGPRGKPAQLSQASTPTSASRAPVGGRALCDQIQRRWLPRGPHAQSGDKEGSRALGSTIQGRLRARPGRRGPGVCNPGAGGGPEAPIGPRGPFLLAPARAGGREGSQASWCPRGLSEPGAGFQPAAPPELDVEAPGPGAPTEAEAWSLGDGAPASPPPSPPPPPAPPAWRAAAATARAAGGARNGAGLCAAPRGGERPSPSARRPQARGPPKRSPRLAPGSGLCVLRVLGAQLCPRTPTCPGRATTTGGRTRTAERPP